jgi:hypothetical protein
MGLFHKNPQRPTGPEAGARGLLKREEARGFLMLLIETFARFPVQFVES